MDKKKHENPDAEAIDMDVDPVPEITRTHFEESMKYARKSVSPSDIRKYEMFKQTLVQSRGLGNWKFPEQPGGSTGQNQQFDTEAAEGEDLYN